MNDFLITSSDIDKLFEDCFSMPTFSRVEFLELSRKKSGYSQRTFLNLLLSRWKEYRVHVFDEYQNMDFDELCNKYGFEFGLKIFGDEPEDFEIFSTEEDVNELSNLIKNTPINFEWLNENSLFLVRDYIYKLYDLYSIDIDKLPQSVIDIIKSAAFKIAEFHLKALLDETYQLPTKLKKEQYLNELTKTNNDIIQYARDYNLKLRKQDEDIRNSKFIHELIMRFNTKEIITYCQYNTTEKSFWDKNPHIKYAAPNEFETDLPNFNIIVNYIALIFHYDHIYKYIIISAKEFRFIKNIQSSTMTGGLGWANGLSGQFKDFNQDYQLRFCETDENCYRYFKKEEEQEKSNVLACGFVAWLIKHWGKDTLSIYSGYYQARLNQYKNEHKNDTDIYKRQLDKEFYNQHIQNEKILTLKSELIFDFITDEEANKIKEYTQNYFEYIVNTYSVDTNTKNEIITTQKIASSKDITSNDTNAKGLEIYFKPSFRGIGENNLNHFETLLNDLDSLRKPVEFAEVALLIYESKFGNSRMPGNFSDWYPIFCNYIGCEQKKYQPKDLRPAREKIKKLFSYLYL